jgi:hypothetical protein
MITASHSSRICKASLAILIAATVCLSCLKFTDSACAATQKAAQKADEKATRVETNKRSAQKTTDKRKEIVSEAVSTLRETQDALKLLDEGKNKEALAAVERATGKLEIVLARDPKVSLVPIDVRVITRDIYGTLDEIKKAKQEAQKALNEGRVQDARNVLSGLASETVISTSNIPLATYPSALKKAAKFIDENKISEAKGVLQTALDTLVVTDVVVPLPVVGARINLEDAEALSEKKTRTDKENTQLAQLVATADTQIKYAEELGYGKRADFDAFHKQIEEIKKKTAGGKSGQNFFDQIKTYIESMTKNSQHNSSAGK